jgi:hypothetical protein
MEDKHGNSKKSGDVGNPYAAYAVIASVCGPSSAGIVFILFVIAKISGLTVGGLWALSAMVFAPALTGVGIAYFVYKSSSVGRFNSV